MKFYGQFEVPVDQFIFERYFNDTGIKGTYVECGAFDGLTESSCKFFEETMGWTGYNIEPVPWIFEKLVKNRSTSTNINAALSNASGSAVFHSVIHPDFGRDVGWGSLRQDAGFHEMVSSAGGSTEEIAVNLISWSDFVASHGLSTIDLMVLDVEGHELTVLDGMRGSNVLPHVMCVEFGHVGFDKLRQSMGEIGYEYDIHSFANAFFIRRDMVPLFALRRAKNETKRQDIEKSHAEQLGAAYRELEAVRGQSSTASEQYSALLKQHDITLDENKWLRSRETELVNLVESIFRSRGWKALELARNVLFRKKRAGNI